MARGFYSTCLDRADIRREIQMCSLFISEGHLKYLHILTRRRLLKEYRERFIDG